MTLEDLVNDISNLDQDLIIFQKNELSIDSEVFLFEPGDEEGDKYVYLLEVSLANEFINDWVKTIPERPNSKEIALRLFQYAINDA